MKEAKVARRREIRDTNEDLRPVPAIGGSIIWFQKDIPVKDDFTVPMGALYRKRQQANARFSKQNR